MQWSYIGLPGYLHSDGMVKRFLVCTCWGLIIISRSLDGLLGRRRRNMGGTEFNLTILLLLILLVTLLAIPNLLSLFFLLRLCFTLFTLILLLVVLFLRSI